MSYLTDGRRWASGKCEVNLTGPAWPSQWRSSAQNAMRAWDKPPSFNFKEVPGVANHLAAYDLGRWNGWLGMTYVDPGGPKACLTSAKMLINTFWEFDPPHPSGHTDSGGAFDLESVLIHEYGHMLHLDDETTAQHVMAPTLKRRTTRRALGPDDHAGRACLYPLLAEFEPTELKQQSIAVVRGRVTATQIAVWEYDLEIGSDSETVSLQLVLSAHELRIAEVYKGNLTTETSVQVVTMGGATPYRSLQVSGEAVFYPNEEVILFLSTDHEFLTGGSKHKKKELYRHTPYYLPNVGLSSGTYSVFGGFQGKYSVYSDGQKLCVVRQGTYPDYRNPTALPSFIESL